MLVISRLMGTHQLKNFLSYVFKYKWGMNMPINVYNKYEY